LNAGEGGLYDFGFVDADKTAYDDYYELGLKLLRKGGVMLFDNMLWSGKVADERDQSPDTVALRALALKARDDDRVFSTMSSIGDGLLFVIKK
jgi:caffeoyl-CoA O-methyltransferase